MQETWVAPPCGKSRLWSTLPQVLGGCSLRHKPTGDHPGMRSAYWGPRAKSVIRFSVRLLRSSPVCVVCVSRGRGAGCSMQASRRLSGEQAHSPVRGEVLQTPTPIDSPSFSATRRIPPGEAGTSQDQRDRRRGGSSRVKSAFRSPARAYVRNTSQSRRSPWRRRRHGGRDTDRAQASTARGRIPDRCRSWRSGRSSA
jgi:hypothetical protein